MHAPQAPATLVVPARCPARCRAAALGAHAPRPAAAPGAAALPAGRGGPGPGRAAGPHRKVPGFKWSDWWRAAGMTCQYVTML